MSQVGYIITWILHQIILYSNKVKLVADLNNDPPFTPFTPLLLYKRTDQ